MKVYHNKLIKRVFLLEEMEERKNSQPSRLKEILQGCLGIFTTPIYHAPSRHWVSYPIYIADELKSLSVEDIREYLDERYGSFSWNRTKKHLYEQFSLMMGR